MAKALTAADLVTMLRAAPDRIAEAVVGVPPGRLRARPAPDEWSAVEVLAHLRSCADVWGDCVRTILAADHPTIRAVNPTTYIESTDYAGRAFAASLREFTAQRAELVALLDGLAAADWSRAATVTGAGKPLERSVHDYVERLAVHERPHLKQIGRAAAAVQR